MMDVVVVGGGVAGLSAALVLGRSRRRALVVDDGKPRNAPSPEAHSMFTRDGAKPAELLRIGREQLAPYDTVELRDGRVVAATGVRRRSAPRPRSSNASLPGVSRSTSRPPTDARSRR